MMVFLAFGGVLCYIIVSIMDNNLHFAELASVAYCGERFTMKRRIIAGVLLLAMLCAALPSRIHAAESREQRIKNKITTVYTKSLKRLGTSSFEGYCGRAVNNQLYHLGIDTKVLGCDGKNEFDMYQKKGTTSGGYPCRPYPASKYSLQSALNEICANGTRDVYNILVGFESTRTQAGKNYGHTVLIYAILDGIVYFAECCDAIIDGKRWPERSPIYCSVETFSNYYNSWATLDGLIWFGNKSYSEQCESYDAWVDAMALTDVQMFAEIPNPKDYEQPEQLDKVYAGQILSATRLLKTPEGAYWYEAEQNGNYGYVEATAFKTLHNATTDISADWSSVQMPAFLYQGTAFVLGGEIRVEGKYIQKLKVSVHKSTAADTAKPVYVAETETNAKFLFLSEVTDGTILWKELAEGNYRLTIHITVANNTLENGQIQEQSRELEIWRSEFRVIRKNTWVPEISFDACGGNALLDRTVTDYNGTLDKMPQAQRKGYVFLGWYTHPEEGDQITQETRFTLNTVVYAHWAKDPEYTGWLQTNGEWTYYRSGEPVYGWFRYNGLRFWQDNFGHVPKGWRKIQGQWYHFSGVGAVNTGWIETERGVSFLRADGRPAVGNIIIQGKEWGFDESGILVLH